MEAIQGKTADIKGLKKIVAEWAKKKGLKGNRRLQRQ